MGNNIFIKEASKVNWDVPAPKNGTGYPGDLNIIIACLQRIAASAELIAANNQKLIDDRDLYKKKFAERTKEMAHLKKSIVGFRGQITKLKRKK